MLSRRRLIAALAGAPLLAACAAAAPPTATLPTAMAPPTPAPTIAPTPVPTVVPSPTPVPSTTLTLFHETHTHGQLVNPKTGMRFERFVGLRDKLRAELPGPGHSLTLGNGDDLEGYLNGKGTEARHTVESFNAAGMDADTIGFNELDLAPEVFRQRVGECRFPWVSANVRDASGGGAYGHAAGVRPWVVREVGGIRVGLTGYIISTARINPPMRGAVVVVDAAAALGEAAAQLRSTGAQVVVVLDHGSHEETVRIAESVEGIDLFVGTHVGPILDQPRRVRNSLISIAGWDMERLGQLTLTIRDGRVVDHAYRFHVPSPTGPTNAAVAAALAPYAG
jgi:5'-nucleotidase/UDP-sugar diphosphatase